MYTFLILLIMIIIPIPVMTKNMLAGRNAYQGVLKGSVSAMAGVTVVFLLFWAMTGASFFEVLEDGLNSISAEDMNLMERYAVLGLEMPEPEELQLTLDHIKETTKLAVPGVIIVFSLVIAYINYGILSRLISRSGRKIAVLPPFRSFSLPRSIVIGSLLIYILTYLTIKTGIIDENLIMFNLEMLFLFVMIIQGMAVTFYFGYIKKIPKPVLLILSGIFILTWLGQTVLFLLGLIDVMFNIRKRISQTKL